MRICSFLPAVVAVALLSTSWAEPPNPEEIRALTDVAYKQGDALTDYEKTRCKLDVYLPKEAKGYATLVWFHGGGLTGGNKSGETGKAVPGSTAQMARSLAAAGICVVSANYRLSPKVTFPAYIQDAAAAVAWARKHVSGYGGNPDRLFVGGHSAGAYLALMLGMDPHYLADVGMKPSDVAGFIPVSGQTMTHYTVRQERGGEKNAITADEAAPVHFARAETPPFLVLYADRDMVARAEENEYFVALMKGIGNKRVTGQLIKDRTHGSIAGNIVNEGDPAREAILQFMKAGEVPEPAKAN